MIEARLEKKTKEVLQPIGGKRLLLVVDDLNMGKAPKNQPSLELFRGLLDRGFWYERSAFTLKHIKVCASLHTHSPIAMATKSKCTSVCQYGHCTTHSTTALYLSTTPHHTTVPQYHSAKTPHPPHRTSCGWAQWGLLELEETTSPLVCRASSTSSTSAPCLWVALWRGLV